MPRQLSDWLSLLESSHPVEIDLGLERVAKVAAHLAHKKPAPRIITVAGTNGKGSCIAVLQALIEAAGFSTGIYTSPHLIHFNERIVIRGRQVDDQQLCDAFVEVEAARIAANTSLTYFEFTTLAALLIIQLARIDVALLEVGLGGRLDAVNLVDTDIAVVTGIALDHQSWLGESLDAIGYEKASIARSGKPLVYGDVKPVASVIETTASIGATLYQIGKDFNLIEDVFSSSLNRKVTVPRSNLPSTSIACALQVAELLGINIGEPDIYQAISRISLPGRYQLLFCNNRQWLLDVAHNPQAAERLASQLQRDFSKTRIIAVFAAMSDKDLTGIIAPLQDSVSIWVLPEIDLVRAATPQSLTALLYNNEVVPSVALALQRARELAAEDDLILVFGSFYLVGPVLEQLTESEGKVQNESVL